MFFQVESIASSDRPGLSGRNMLLFSGEAAEVGFTCGTTLSHVNGHEAGSRTQRFGKSEQVGPICAASVPSASGTQQESRQGRSYSDRLRVGRKRQPARARQLSQGDT